MIQYATQNKTGDWAKLMNLLLQLRKVCNHPYILPNSEPEPYENGEHLILASSKLIFLDKFLPQLFAQGHRVLIFSQFTKMLDILEDFMRFRSVPYARLDGRTSRPRRNLDIRLFQRKDSPYKVFLISTKAGGLGINLTTADTVIMIDNDLQAMARSHRIGQTKNVKVYRTISRDTVEEQMLTRLQKKLFLSMKVTSGGRQNEDDAMPSLSKEDLLTIFRYGTKTITNDSEDDPELFVSKTADEILQGSRDHAAKLLESVSDNVEAPTEFELEGFESVKSRFFEGVDHRVAKKTSKTNSDIAAEWETLAKRTSVQRTVQVGENMVLKELEGCEQWEAAPVITTQSRRAASLGGAGEKKVEKVVKRVKKKFDHQESMKALERTVLYFCPQHQCCICDRKTQDAGGLLFRCGTCSNAYCEDCLPIDEEITEIGETLPAFEELGYGAINQAYFIRCPPCVQYAADVKKEVEARETEGGMEVDAAGALAGDDVVDAVAPGVAVGDAVPGAASVGGSAAPVEPKVAEASGVELMDQVLGDAAAVVGGVGNGEGVGVELMDRVLAGSDGAGMNVG
ncbi:hypothetical protein HDU98_004713, partial [Podochytrium sp. JEL0797]